MSGNIYLDALLIFLVIYGFVHILHGIGSRVMEHISERICSDCMVLTLSAGSETMEMDIRNSVTGSLKVSRALVIVDTGISEEELFLLWRLTDAYDHIIMATPENMTEKIREAQALTKTL